MTSKSQENLRDGWSTPSASPKFTGSLYMSEYCGSIAHTLSKLTGGLRSARVGMGCRIDKVRSGCVLASRYAYTPGSLSIDDNIKGSALFPTFLIHR